MDQRVPIASEINLILDGLLYSVFTKITELAGRTLVETIISIGIIGFTAKSAVSTIRDRSLFDIIT